MRRERASVLTGDAAVAAALLAGCGGGAAKDRAAVAPVPTTSTSTASAGAAPSPHVSARLRAREAAMHRQVLAALHHDTGSRSGRLPADLRHRQRAPAGQVLSASLARPAEPIQGVTVRLHLDGSSARATGVGPFIPDREQGTFDLHTPAAWTVRFTDVHGRFPLRAGMFSLTDAQGQTLRPRVTTAAGRRLPGSITTGRSLTVRLRSDLISEGDGKLRYAPVSGHLLVEWDFDVETD